MATSTISFEERLTAAEGRMYPLERVFAEMETQAKEILEQMEALAADLEQLAADDA